MAVDAPTDDERSMFCRVCRRALHILQVCPGVLSYRHSSEMAGGQADHAPDPVSLSELPSVIQQCDFCGVESVAWAYSCADHVTHVRQVRQKVFGPGQYHEKYLAGRASRVKTTRVYTTSWGRGWAACEDCAELIEQEDIVRLVTRVVDRLPGRLIKGKRLLETRAWLYGVYEDFFKTKIPGRGQITPDQPDGIWISPEEELINE